jgi:hypothetical protein
LTLPQVAEEAPAVLTGPGRREMAHVLQLTTVGIVFLFLGAIVAGVL